MDYHLLSWKTKITASKRGAPSGKKNGLFQMTDISPSLCALELCDTDKHPNINVDTDSIGTTVWLFNSL